MDRRNFIRAAGASAIATTAAIGAPAVFTSHAADVSSYKALVCVFLYGGLDCHDVLIPFDASGYNAWRTIRSSFVARQGTTRDQSSLLPLTRQSEPTPSEPQFALPPELSGIKAIYDQGDAAIVANVGPLIEPITRAGFQSGASNIPARLFSHNDQQITWLAGAPEGAQFGWGGLFADAVLAAGANRNGQQFTTITTDEAGPFLSGNTARPYRVTVSGAAEVQVFNDFGLNDDTDFQAAIRDQLASRAFMDNHVIETDIANAFRTGIDTNARYEQALAGGIPNFAGFEGGGLTAQLRAVANTISVRSRLSAQRQIFLVAIGGFDTHSAQAQTLPALLSEVDSGVSGFYNAMASLGLSEQVTLFTASDFGRTLVVNGDGTDHGWGGHHFVVGGAVNGREIYGDVPPPSVNHSLDAGRGRLIPGLAVDQYAGQLGRWFGLDSSELATALPNLGRFNPPASNFI